MKINGPNHVYQINQIYKKNTQTKFDKNDNVATSKEDRIELSKTSKDVQKYIDQVKKSPTGNQEKIGRIKKAIKQGTYQVSSKQLAEAIANKIYEQKEQGRE